jgi:hypothetical protein
MISVELAYRLFSFDVLVKLPPELLQLLSLVVGHGFLLYRDCFDKRHWPHKILLRYLILESIP